LLLVFWDDTPIAHLPDGRKMRLEKVALRNIDWEFISAPDFGLTPLEKIQYWAKRPFLRCYPVSNPRQDVDFRGFLVRLPWMLRKQIYISRKLNDPPDHSWPVTNFRPVESTNDIILLTEREWIESTLANIRTNGVLFGDATGSKPTTNYPCVIISSRNEIRILTEGEFEAVSSNH
jgi:hypothetical protein